MSTGAWYGTNSGIVDDVDDVRTDVLELGIYVCIVVRIFNFSTFYIFLKKRSTQSLALVSNPWVLVLKDEGADEDRPNPGINSCADGTRPLPMGKLGISKSLLLVPTSSCNSVKGIQSER